tara:strand:- start:141 stop:692 length:552 start_codon:yes stop_codon:yes gene_type:complete
MKKTLLILGIALVTLVGCEKESLEDDIIENVVKDKVNEEEEVEKVIDINTMLESTTPRQLYLNGVSYDSIIGSTYNGGTIYQFDTITFKTYVYVVIKKHKYYNHHNQHLNVYYNNNWNICSYSQLKSVSEVTNLKSSSLINKYWTSDTPYGYLTYLVYDHNNKNVVHYKGGTGKYYTILIGEY